MSDRERLEELTLLLAEARFKVDIAKVHDPHHLAEILKADILKERLLERNNSQRTKRRRRTEH